MRSSLIRSQVAPPSSERKSPPSSASTMAQTRSARAGETATPILPLSPAGKPGLPLRSCQLSPPSVERQSPLSGPPLERLQGWRSVSQNAA